MYFLCFKQATDADSGENRKFTYSIETPWLVIIYLFIRLFVYTILLHYDIVDNEVILNILLVCVANIMLLFPSLYDCLKIYLFSHLNLTAIISHRMSDCLNCVLLSFLLYYETYFGKDKPKNKINGQLCFIRKWKSLLNVQSNSIMSCVNDL